jgi:sortase B
MKKKHIYIVIGVLFVVAAALCAWHLVQITYAPKAVVSEAMTPQATEAPAATEPPAAVEAEETQPEATESPAPEETTEPYDSPVDFASLRSVNSDIYAWLEIDNTNISYPIVQSPDDDTFYLNHNTDGNYSANGSIYSEHEYNGLDFSDPVTLLYGHHMSSGAMFGNLQQYFSDSSFFEENPIIKVYTEDGLLEYGVFAAVPYSNDHLMYYNDFTDEEVFESFFQSIFNIRNLDAQFREEYAPEAGDKVLILSTCLAGNNTRRFLVMATLLQ